MAELPDMQALPTRFGRLAVVGHDGAPDTVTVDGKIAFQQEQMYIALHAVYRMGDADVVLLGYDCGGSGCSDESLALLVLRAGAAPQVVSRDDFIAHGHQLEARLTEQDLRMRLGFVDRKAVSATYSGGQLSVLTEASALTELSHDDCALVYRQVLVDSCAVTDSTTFDCFHIQDDFSHANVGLLQYLSNLPGFRPEVFKHMCTAACRQHHAPPYSTFAARVCR